MARNLVFSSTQYLTFSETVTSVTNFTMAIWVRKRSNGTLLAGNTNILISGQASPFLSLRGRLGTGSDLHLTYTWELTADEFNATTGLILSTGWQLCAVTIEPTRAIVYRALPGAPYSTFTNTKTHNAKSQSAWGIGHVLIGTPAYWDGEVAEVGMWNVTLTGNEIQALANGVQLRRVRPQSQIVNYPLWGDHSPEIELLGGPTATLVGAPAKGNHAPVTLPLGYGLLMSPAVPPPPPAPPATVTGSSLRPVLSEILSVPTNDDCCACC